MRRLNSHCLCPFIVIVIKSAQYAVIWSTLLLSLACSFLPLILSFLWMTFYSFVSFDFFVSFFLVAIFSMLGSVLIVCLSVLFFSLCECVCFWIVLHYFALIVAFTIAWLFVFRILYFRIEVCSVVCRMKKQKQVHFYRGWMYLLWPGFHFVCVYFGIDSFEEWKGVS